MFPETRGNEFGAEAQILKLAANGFRSRGSFGGRQIGGADVVVMELNRIEAELREDLKLAFPGKLGAHRRAKGVGAGM